MRPAIEAIVPIFLIAGFVWLPLLPALVWGKCAIPAADVGRLLRRAAKLSVLGGLPLAFLAHLLFGRMDPYRPALSESLRVAALLALIGLPLYGAVVATNVFQQHHRASSAPRRPWVVRSLSAVVILAANLFALMFVFFFLFAVSGVYRGWR